MNKEEFVTMVKEELAFKLEDRYPGISVTVQETGGPGKAPYLGATIQFGEGNVFPVLNLDAIYEECGNWPEYEIMQELIEKSV